MANSTTGSAQLGIPGLVNLDLDLKLPRGLMKLLGRSTWTAIQKEAIRDVAHYWHDDILPKHFQRGNETEYRLEKRSKYYLRQIKPKTGRGKGKGTLETLKGESERAMRHIFTVTGTSRMATLKMAAPKHFTRPFVGRYRDQFGRPREITRQPNKIAEVTRISEADRQLLRRRLRQNLQDAVAAHLNRGAGI